ncbi:hypothetical protein MUDCAT_73 [Arthrobacter phage Mudcat]|uniref:Uncharacterized protein n=5 Tax=Mudcatvirus TaxID=1982088 RepID=A0A222Z7L6_9CAUD|nr:hypothetical protein BI184_gp73 [Arthrobacter phage Mudcat]YP_010666065.1 hypothetical protein PQB74_gp77 [Arthrobacter phage Arcadia]YP_010666265.1 hypothetical protein PQB76_gp078 [Arthrobacter phage Cheesy]YP_010666555.1 hypothetical protein PQB79_gp076 [Arthrobacter phage Heisenberger]YP_010666655.1 hypothetical protein PQB80_gp076 [Arthrobacter phage JEGGS]ASR80233.1 hypothetical protein SEA_ELSA_77 [Arthrobacter phage Elsa]ASR80430.1 hypothetical protein SEA_NASON_77 [Arthrobacter ph
MPINTWRAHLKYPEDFIRPPGIKTLPKCAKHHLEYEGIDDRNIFMFRCRKCNLLCLFSHTYIDLLYLAMTGKKSPDYLFPKVKE